MRPLTEIKAEITKAISNPADLPIVVLDRADCVLLAQELDRLARYEAAAVALRQNVKDGILQIVKASPGQPPPA